MARTALGESHDCSWAANGWEVMSFFVCFLYAFKAVAKIDLKSVEDVAVGRTWDMRLVESNSQTQRRARRY